MPVHSYYMRIYAAKVFFVDSAGNVLLLRTILRLLPERNSEGEIKNKVMR